MSLYQAYKNYIESKKHKEIDFEKMTLRQVMEYTKTLTLAQGGMVILIEKIVSSIEKLEKANETKSP